MQPSNPKHRAGPMARALGGGLALILSVSASAAVIAPGAAAPAFQLHSSGNTDLSLSDLKGQVVLINFWASWCGPCRQEMPVLEQLYKKYKAAGFPLLGVNVEPNPPMRSVSSRPHLSRFRYCSARTARSVNCMRCPACRAP